MSNNLASLTAEEILTEARRMIDSKRWRSTSTALNAYREFIDMAMPRMMDIVEQQREQIAALDTANAGLRRRLHIVDQHNQHFERCESTWCNPNGTLVVGRVRDEAAIAGSGYRDALHEAWAKIAALEIRLAGTEAENRWMNTRYQNLQTDMEELEKERDSLLFGLEEWMERFGTAEASCPK